MTKPLSQKFLKLLRETEILPPGSRVLVAVSGGADSVALLSLLTEVADECSLSLVVAHLDHGLRPESSADARFVKDLADSMKVPAVVERVEINTVRDRTAGGPEEIARKIRRKFLERAAQTHDCALVALAHHREDQAETFLLNLLRGAGPQGLSGMRLYEPPYVRPLLGFARDELREYLTERGFAWREDDSNQDVRFTRNRIRHELLPVLATFNPRISVHLAQLCQRLGEDEDCWRELIERELFEISRSAQGIISLPCDLLKHLPAAFANRLLRAALEKVRGDLRRISAVHIEAVRSLLDSERPQAEVHLPGAWVARRYDALLVSRAAPEVKACAPVEIEGEGVYPLPDGRALRVELEVEARGESCDTVEFPVSSVSLPLLVRTFRAGDRFSPDGMSGSRKLQDLFVDLKLTHEQRASQPLVIWNRQILWVVGLRRCADFVVKSTAPEKVVRLQIVSSEMLTKRL